MLSRIYYFLRETTTSLVRNISMTLGAVLTIFVTLSLVGVSLLVYFWNAEGVKTVEQAVRFEVFMLTDADQSQIDAVQEELDNDIEAGNVVRVTFYDKDQAFEFFQNEFRDQPDLLKAVTKEDLPVSFLVAPTSPEESSLDDIIARYEVIPGVETVTKADFADEIRRARTINQTLAVFAVVLLIASCVLVFNTVRLAVYARRREIEIMKLVGASNWFVQVPFMAEGAFQGLVGGGLATVTAVVFKQYILDEQFSEGFRGFVVTPGWMAFTIFAVLALGIFVGLASSYAGLKRYLDV